MATVEKALLTQTGRPASDKWVVGGVGMLTSAAAGKRVGGGGVVP